MAGDDALRAEVRHLISTFVDDEIDPARDVHDGVTRVTDAVLAVVAKRWDTETERLRAEVEATDLRNTKICDELAAQPRWKERWKAEVERNAALMAESHEARDRITRALAALDDAANLTYVTERKPWGSVTSYGTPLIRTSTVRTILADLAPTGGEG